MINVIDAHIHIKAAGNYFQPGCTCFVNSVDSGQWELLLRLAAENPAIVPFFGIHPWFIQTIKEADFRLLEDIISRDRSYNIGEIGLDRIRARKNPVLHNFERQLAVFQTQLGMAVKYGRAVTIHCVKAWDALFPVLEVVSHNGMNSFKGVIHYFSASLEIMNRLLDYGFYISFFPGFHTSANTLDVFRACPLNRLLLETDREADTEAFSLLEAHYRQAALHRGMELKDLTEAIEANGKIFTN